MKKSPHPSITSNNRRLYYPDDVDVVSIISSNATESDLPGPGRTLGRVYGYLGRHLKRALGALAERKGLGPQQVALRILNRDTGLGDQTNCLSISKYEKKNGDAQLQDFKKLLRYTRYVALLSKPI